MVNNYRNIYGIYDGDDDDDDDDYDDDYDDNRCGDDDVFFLVYNSYPSSYGPSSHS